MVPATCTECGAALEVEPVVGATVVCDGCGITLRVIEVNESAGKVYLEPVEGEQGGEEDEDQSEG